MTLLLSDIEPFIDELKKQINRAKVTCLTCTHFTEDTEACGLYGQRPPARVIAYGCPSYVDKEPPF